MHFQKHIQFEHSQFHWLYPLTLRLFYYYGYCIFIRDSHCYFCSIAIDLKSCRYLLFYNWLFVLLDSNVHGNFRRNWMKIYMEFGFMKIEVYLRSIFINTKQWRNINLWRCYNWWWSVWWHYIVTKIKSRSLMKS